MNPDDRRLIVAIGQAARTCAMYRELLEVARRYQHPPEVQRLAQSLADADAALSRLIAQALDDDEMPTAEAPAADRADEPRADDAD